MVRLSCCNAIGRVGVGVDADVGGVEVEVDVGGEGEGVGVDVDVGGVRDRNIDRVPPERLLMPTDTR